VSEEKKSSKKKYFAIILAIIPIVVILVSLVVLIPEINEEDTSSERINLSQETSQLETQQVEETTKKAVILDQLNNDLPNYFFQDRAQEYLELAGYTVDLFTTDDLTVEFYKNLPTMDYDFIIFRTHGAGGGYLESSFLFTGEPYSQTKYVQEQIFEQIRPGVPIVDYEHEIVDADKIGEVEYDMFFTIGSEMIDDLMVGEFQDTVILIGGCDALRNTDLSEALLRRGASNVIGWNGIISSVVNDRAMLVFLEELLINEVKINDAIKSVSDKYGPFEDGTELKHYRI